MVDLSKEIEKYVSDKRLAHSLAVEGECRALGKLFGLNEDEIGKLSVAGYLHDITKLLTLDEQLELCKKFGIEYDESDLFSHKLFHAKTGAYLARQNYPELVDDYVFNCIYYHTTGRADMTLGEKLVYLADYIEPTRKHDDCIELRKYFYSKPEGKDLYRHLDDTLILSFDMTIKDLMDDGKTIDSNTVSARNFLVLAKKKEETVNG